MILRSKCHYSDSRGFVQQNSSLDTNTAIHYDQLYVSKYKDGEDFNSDSGVDWCMYIAVAVTFSITLARDE